MREIIRTLSAIGTRETWETFAFYVENVNVLVLFVSFSAPSPLALKKEMWSGKVDRLLITVINGQIFLNGRWEYLWAMVAGNIPTYNSQANGLCVRGTVCKEQILVPVNRFF